MEKNGEKAQPLTNDTVGTVPRTQKSALSNEPDRASPSKRPIKPVIKPVDRRSEAMKKMDQLEKSVKEANDAI